jgi:hypothetical protein
LTVEKTWSWDNLLILFTVLSDLENLSSMNFKWTGIFDTSAQKWWSNMIKTLFSYYAALTSKFVEYNKCKLKNIMSNKKGT